ncbi:helix-turn-helix domain-containing protein [Hoeflea sp.]|uniref:helix-turn-helix domain-containing protein n=1 Tax=Hoeflea sp. TaxID=1940281 RepID=UPI0037499703
MRFQGLNFVKDQQRRHGRRPRTIRDLFYAYGTSFSDHVLATRLEQAHRLLSDVARQDLTITTIAYRSGFNDLSWFNQAFRRRYAMAPSNLRKIAQETHFT